MAGLHWQRASRHLICELTRTITNIPRCATGIRRAAFLIAARFPKAKRPGPSRARPRRIVSMSALEALLQADVPEPAFDGSKRLIVTVLERACHKRRIFVRHVLHA